MRRQQTTEALGCLSRVNRRKKADVEVHSCHQKGHFASEARPVLLRRQASLVLTGRVPAPAVALSVCPTHRAMPSASRACLVYHIMKVNLLNTSLYYLHPTLRGRDICHHLNGRRAHGRHGA